MRVRGNISPDVLRIEAHRPSAGHVVVRLRDNINPIVGVDGMTGREILMFEYDEFTFILVGREGLREDIEANMADWLATGRTLEVNAGASILADMEAQNEEYERRLRRQKTHWG